MRPYSIMVVGLLFCLAGCGTSTAPVTGRVTMGGKPLVNATVIFQPISDDMNPGPGSQGKTDADGHYTLRLLTGDTAGAILGKHAVKITAYEGDDGTVPSSGPDMKFRKRMVADEYNVKTILTFDVPAGGSSSADFDVKPPPESK